MLSAILYLVFHVFWVGLIRFADQIRARNLWCFLLVIFPLVSYCVFAAQT